MSQIEDRGGTAVESELEALLARGYTRTDATELVIERTVAGARSATTVVLVEGLSDQIALEVLARRQGRRLRDEGVSVVPMGGATNIGRFLAIFGPRERNVRLVGLYDRPVEERLRRSLVAAGAGGSGELEQFGFYACVDDLEDEFIRALGPDTVEAIVAAQGELRSLRSMQNMPFHRQQPRDRQLHRFIAAQSGRKYRYARLLALSLDLTELPRPIEGLLAHV